MNSLLCSLKPALLAILTAVCVLSPVSIQILMPAPSKEIKVSYRSSCSSSSIADTAVNLSSCSIYLVAFSYLTLSSSSLHTSSHSLSHYWMYSSSSARAPNANVRSPRVEKLSISFYNYSYFPSITLINGRTKLSAPLVNTNAYPGAAIVVGRT